MILSSFVRRTGWSRIAGLALAIAATGGCYDAVSLVKDRRSTHDLVQLEEVDLGSFRVTLPHTPGESIDHVVAFHVFGHVKRGDREAIDHAIKMRGPELRSRMLIEVRAMDEKAFEEPKLTTLRQSIVEAINGTLDRKLVRGVGFYKFSFNTT